MILPNGMKLEVGHVIDINKNTRIFWNDHVVIVESYLSMNHRASGLWTFIFSTE